MMNINGKLYDYTFENVKFDIIISLVDSIFRDTE